LPWVFDRQRIAESPDYSGSDTKPEAQAKIRLKFALAVPGASGGYEKAAG